MPKLLLSILLTISLFPYSSNGSPAEEPVYNACVEASQTEHFKTIQLTREISASSETKSVPAAAFTWDANIHYANFNRVQESKVEAALGIMRKVIASEEFRKQVLNYTYDGKKSFIDNDGLTNAQVYQKILDGAEKMGNTTKNNLMDVELELYFAATTTIGYTYPNVSRIWMNTKYFDRYSPTQVAGNLMHEWMHKLGFAHASKWSPNREHSVPYAIGYLMEELTKQYK